MSRRVMRSVANVSQSLKLGRYSRTGMSQLTIPSSTSRLTAVVVKVLVVDPIGMSVCGVTSRPSSTLRRP